MKVNTVIAISVSVGLLLLIGIQAALYLAPGMNESKPPVLSPRDAVISEYFLTPLIFAAIGLVFGLIASAKDAMRSILLWAIITGVAIAAGLTAGLHALLGYAQQALWSMGKDVNLGVGDSAFTAASIPGLCLWVAWYVAGAVGGHGIRKRMRAASKPQAPAPPR